MKNVGTIDRVLRIVVGLALISIVFIGPQTPWGWIGVVPLGDRAVGLLPIIQPAGNQDLPCPKGLITMSSTISP